MKAPRHLAAALPLMVQLSVCGGGGGSTPEFAGCINSRGWFETTVYANACHWKAAPGDSLVDACSRQLASQFGGSRLEYYRECGGLGVNGYPHTEIYVR